MLINRSILSRLSYLFLASTLLSFNQTTCWAKQAKDFAGSIDSKYGIKMEIERTGDQIEGTYTYTSKNIPLKLKGTIDESSKFLIEEFDPKGVHTGTFDGKLVDGKRLFGTWVGANGGAHLPFVLALSGSSAALDSGKDGIIITQSITKVSNPKASVEPGGTTNFIYPQVDRQAYGNPLLAHRIQSALSQQRGRYEAELKEGIGWTGLDYSVRYNKNYLVDVESVEDFCGAYPVRSTHHIIVNTKTGQVVHAKDVFNASTLSKLKALVSAKQKAEAAQAEKSYKEDPQMRMEGVSSLKEQLDSSQHMYPIDLNKFTISDTGVTFLYDWQFPHAIQCAQPDGQYTFTYQALKPFIRTDGPLAQFVK